MSEKTAQTQFGSQQELSFAPVCPSCGAPLSEKARFCPNCGGGISAPSKSDAPAVTLTAAAAPARGPQSAAVNNVSGVPENIAGLLAYFILPAIAFLTIEPFKRNRFVRFHSIQCLLTIGVLVIAQFVLVLLGKVMPLLVLSLYGLLILAELALWLLLLYKAFQHETFKLPVLGDIAETLAAKN